MAKRKRNKDRFWCHECRKVGYRTEDQARAVALTEPAARIKVIYPCPDGWGWHFGPFEPKPGGDPAG